MKGTRSDATGTEPHVFDQTNGVVDLGDDGTDSDGVKAGKPDSRSVAGIAMLSTQRP